MTRDRDLTLILSRSWSADGSELSFVTRAVAGGASRRSHVVVVVPATPATTISDGAFDVVGVGHDNASGWPELDQVSWPAAVLGATRIVLDSVDQASLALLAQFRESAAFFIDGDPAFTSESVRPLRMLSPESPDFVGIHVPVSDLAAGHRHGGFGFTDYVLVLTDRPGVPAITPPTAGVAWLTAAFHDRYIVVVEGATASAWKGRALRGTVAVDTRTDLWRLVAHARMVVDLAPGSVVARECLEALRYGVPIVVPNSSAAATHVHSSAGVVFDNVGQMVAGVESLHDDQAHSTAAESGRRYAADHYGDPRAFVERLWRAMNI